MYKRESSGRSVGTTAEGGHTAGSLSSSWSPQQPPLTRPQSSPGPHAGSPGGVTVSPGRERGLWARGGHNGGWDSVLRHMLVIGGISFVRLLLYNLYYKDNMRNWLFTLSAIFFCNYSVIAPPSDEFQPLKYIKFRWDVLDSSLYQ